MKEHIEKLIELGLSIKNIDVTAFICNNLSSSDIEINENGEDCFIKIENESFYFFMSFFIEEKEDKIDLINFDKHEIFSFIGGCEFDYNPELILNHLKNQI